MILPRIALSLPFLHVLVSATAQRWVNLAPIPNPRQEHSTVAIDENTIAVVGGVSASDVPGESTDLVQLYSISSNTWRTVAPIPFRVNHPNVAAVGGKIYVLGGLVDDPTGTPGSVDWIASGESHVYDPTNNSWTTLESMPNGTERGSATVGVHGKIIYLAGGMTFLNTSGQDAITPVTAFNTTSGHWQTLPSIAANIPEARQHAAGAVVGNTFYVACGRVFPRENVRDTVFALDLKNQAAGWKTVGHFQTARGGVTGAVVGSKFYTFGGEANVNNPLGIFNQTDVLDLRTKKSKTLSIMAVPRHGTSAVAIRNRIYIPGGGLQQDGLPVTINGTTTFSQITDHFDAYIV